MPNVYIKKPHYKQELDSSCIPACLRMVLEFFGTHIINVLKINDEHCEIKAAIEFWSLNQLKDHLAKYKAPCIVTVGKNF